MLRKKREVTAPDEITDIIRRSTTLRVGFYGEEYPYVVPVSFGFEIRDGKPVFYFHGAKIGCKLDLLGKDDRVCAESDIFLGVTPTQRGITTLYESFIAFGRGRHGERREGEGAPPYHGSLRVWGISRGKVRRVRKDLCCPDYRHGNHREAEPRGRQCHCPG